MIATEQQTLQALPRAGRVGTSSPRRGAQLLYHRPDLQIVPLRGNVETRLEHALSRKLDAVVLAWAGLQRLGLEKFVTERLAPPRFLPAVGQGALGIECRCDDLPTLALLKHLDDSVARRAVLAERAALAGLEGGCNLPMAAWGRDIVDEQPEPSRPLLALSAAVFEPSGRDRIEVTLRGPRDDPDNLGRRVAQALRSLGAEALLKSKLDSIIMSG